MLRPILASAAVLAVGAPVFADTVYVDTTGSIQAAIEGAADGDTIEVAPGTYFESIDTLGKAITLTSSGGPEATVIDATGLDSSVIRCMNGEWIDTVISGFTLTGGTGTLIGGNLHGGGVFVQFANPMISDCVITGNTAVAGGGMVVWGMSYGRVSDCVFVDNTATGGGLFGGGGLFCQGGDPTIVNCEFVDNHASGAAKGGGIGVHIGRPKVTNCLFYGNLAHHGGAIMNQKGELTLTNCTFGENHAASVGGALRCTYGSAVSVVTNSIFWGNSAGVDGDEIIDQAGAMTTVNFSTVEDGWSGTGSDNTDTDPMFADAVAGNLRLLPESPCIDAGSNDAVTEEFDLDGNSRIFDGQQVDLGAYESQRGVQPKCAADFDQDETVGFSDLLLLLDGWGDCALCPADLDDDGDIDFNDLIEFLNSWGPCT